MSATGAKGSSTTVELSRAERAVARRASEIRATVPHLELSVAADAERVHEACRRAGAGTEACLVRASALALRDVPRANGSYRGDALELYSRINVGVTISEADVYVIPTVFDADAKPAPEIEAELAELRRRARSGELRPPELAGATFTVSHAAEHGILSGAPLVISPQAAALSAGMARSGTIMLDLACDHRILYGAVAARFLNSIREHLER